MAQNVIKRGDPGIDFDAILDEWDHEFSEERRKSGGRSRVKAIFFIDEVAFPELPRELDGYWESNEVDYYVDDGLEKGDIDELHRVEAIATTATEYVRVEQ